MEHDGEEPVPSADVKHTDSTGSEDFSEDEEKFEDVPVVGAHRPKDPRSKAKYNLLSRLLFCWVDSLLWLGCRRDLEQTDLFAHPGEAASEKLLKNFNRHWKTELKRKKKGKQPRLLVTILKCFWWRILLHGILFFIEIAAQVSQAVVLGYLTDYFSIDCPTSEDTRNAYLYALGLVLLGFVIVIFHGHGFLTGYKIGMHSRITLTAAIYQKILSLSQVTVGSLSIGHIVNLASNDVQRFDLAFVFAHVFWLAPIHLGVVTYLVYRELGWSALLIVLFVFLTIPLQVFLGRIFAYTRFKSALVTDKRVRIMNEVISGIRVIKMYAWENAFNKLISKLRSKESRIIFHGGIVRGSSLGFSIVSLTLLMFLIFSVFTASGGELTPRKVFTTLSLLIILRLTTVHFFVQNVLAMTEGRVAVVRLQKLFEMEELTEQKQAEAAKETKSESNEESVEPTGIVVKNMSASWSSEKEKEKVAISNVSFQVDQQYPLLAVVGRVGAGKSSLLQCLLRELKLLDGSIEMKGRVSYVSQEAWIFSATLRENILFGKPYDQEKYNTVLEACALDKDCKQLVDGDLTLVGERGVTLSGGQKARVSLARAVYHDADIYLLDDPLSAVDAAVARHIFDKCIYGFLHNRLVILVTHQVQFALQADKILALKEGRVEMYGSQSELLAQGVDPKQLLGLMSHTDLKKERDLFSVNLQDDDQEASQGSPSSLPTSPQSHLSVPLSPLVQYHQKGDGLTLPVSPSLRLSTPTLRRRHGGDEDNNLQNKLGLEIFPFDTASVFSMPSMLSLHSHVEGVASHHEEQQEELVFTQPPEEKSHGTISFTTYYNFFKAGANLLVLAIMLIFFVLGEGGIVVSDWWISDWAICSQLNIAPENSTCNQSITPESNSVPYACLLSTNQRIAIYAGCSMAAVVLTFVRALLFYFICVNASRVLHNRMFASVLRAPVLFFDTNPIGRVLNRFAKDVGFLDDLLPFIFCEYFLFFWRCIAIIFTAIGSNRWVTIPIILLAIIFFSLRQYFLKTAREVKRLEAIARSPVYSHFSMTLQGLSTIRAMKKEDIALQFFHKYQNEHTQGWYLYIITTRWFGMRIDMISVTLLTAVVFASIPLSEGLNAALVGLAFTYIVSLIGMLQYVVRQSAEVENVMVSAERIMEYSRLEPEAELETLPPNEKPLPNWPDKGMITMEDVAFQYSSELPLVLKDLCFTIQPAEKVGVVGRTGAGKSSLISVLYRLAEPHGLITIDGVDTKAIGLHDLRKKMSIIPQDPVLFSGTMRYNLDPFDEYTDTELWGALEQVQLKSAVQQLEGQLGGEVSEGGSNFSVGQRQLVCLARALLRKNKILVLDEATANVDINTDEIIQQAIRENFSECTVVTIAHRLNTIMDSDRILVMSNGEVKELDSPYNLLQDPRSLFYKMVQKTGPSASKKLQQMALDAHLARKSKL